MQYLVNVIDYRSESGTVQEAVAIDAFNEKLVTGGHWVFAAGLADPTVSTVIDAPDLDVALKLVCEGSKACNRRLEVRPLLSDP
ncbi:hypothetical protein QNO00_01620 [Arthrobacter sp. zg-Y1219]|uniref:hypothetical protein n=1 Tax=Arthrobacter sp. zg-Y1219 TaxID=3049067 RepID=UPI0024C23B58|nr:hypothetical protein [Arthrobacter sp. zg-Y1219]MDK1358968.1 hypothetical protein [Arthrobacter sp. zg-Y1219]